MSNIAVPMSASFTANGQMTVEALPEESFSWASANFNAVDGAMTAAVFNAAFTVTEENPDSETASLTVAMNESGAEAFKNAIAQSLATCTDGNGQTLKAFLEDFAVDELAASLASNGIPDPIEADKVKSTELDRFDAANDCSAGAAELWTAMSAESAQAGRDIIIRQFPRSRFSPETGAAAMPALAGDSVTFRFNISQKYDKVIVAEGAATGQGTVSSYPSDVTLTGANRKDVTSQTVNLKVILS